MIDLMFMRPAKKIEEITEFMNQRDQYPMSKGMMRARIPRLAARVSWSVGKFVLTCCFLQVGRHSGKCHRLIMVIAVQVYQEAR
jgi:hypothetical protein